MEETFFGGPELLGAAAALSEEKWYQDFQNAVQKMLEKRGIPEMKRYILPAMMYMLLGTAARIKDELEDMA